MLSKHNFFSMSNDDGDEHENIKNLLTSRNNFSCAQFISQQLIWFYGLFRWWIQVEWLNMVTISSSLPIHVPLQGTGLHDQIHHSGQDGHAHNPNGLVTIHFVKSFMYELWLLMSEFLHRLTVNINIFEEWISACRTCHRIVTHNQNRWQIAT